MRKSYAWVLAAILAVCGATVFTSCSNDDTPITQEQERQHTEAVSELIRLMDGNPRNWKDAVTTIPRWSS